MAITPRDSETFYREVDEELRKERAANWFKRYGLFVIGGVILLLAAIAVMLWWQHNRREQAGENGAVLAKALEDAGARRTKEATAALDTLAKEGGPGYKAAALMTKASMAAQASVTSNPVGIPGAAAGGVREDAAKRKEAIDLFRQVAENGDFPEPYRQAALIRQTQLEFDALQPAQVISRLQPLATPGNPWFGSAGELVAVAHLKAGRPQQAGPIFAALAKDESLPQTIRSRAVQMAGALGIDAVTDAPAGAAKE